MKVIILSGGELTVTKNMKIKEITFREVVPEDKTQIEEFIIEHWGSNLVVVHNDKYFPSELEGIVAIGNNKICGLITFVIREDKCEIVTLNSVHEKIGIGTELVNLLKESAIKRKCSKVWLITTNDNINAISFYKKLGFKLTQVYPDAVNKSRQIKPEIPLLGENGIPIKDELEFSLTVADRF